MHWQEITERVAASCAAAGFDLAQPFQPGLGDTWRLWLAVRDACPVGREHRYGDDQIGYHYRHDRTLLCPGGRRSVGIGMGDP